MRSTRARTERRSLRRRACGSRARRWSASSGVEWRTRRVWRWLRSSAQGMRWAAVGATSCAIGGWGWGEVEGLIKESCVLSSPSRCGLGYFSSPSTGGEKEEERDDDLRGARRVRFRSSMAARRRVRSVGASLRRASAAAKASRRVLRRVMRARSLARLGSSWGESAMACSRSMTKLYRVRSRVQGVAWVVPRKARTTEVCRGRWPNGQRRASATTRLARRGRGKVGNTHGRGTASAGARHGSSGDCPP